LSVASNAQPHQNALAIDRAFPSDAVATIAPEVERDTLTVGDAAREAGVNPVTVNRAINKGDLAVISHSPRRISRTELDAWQGAREADRASLYVKLMCAVCGREMTRPRHSVRETKSGQHYCGPCSQYARVRLESPVIEARRDEEVRLYVECGLTLEHVADMLHVSTSLVQRDLKLRGISLRPAGFQPKHPKPEERECAREGCSVRFTPTPWDLAAGKGRFCSSGCARRSEEGREKARQGALAQHRAADEEIERLKAENECLDTHELAAELGIAENTLTGNWVKTGRVDAMQLSVRGERPWVYPLRQQAVPGRARQVHLGRRYGHKGAAAGIEAGQALGGRSPSSTPEQQQEMYRLAKEGLSNRAIAEAVFGDRRFKNRVHRFLHR